MLKFFLKAMSLCLLGLYVLMMVSKSFASPSVRFEEYYTHRYVLGPFAVESSGVHGSGADLDGYYANVFYKDTQPLPIRFTDFDPHSWFEILLFFFGGAVVASSVIPLAIWLYLGRPKTSLLPKVSIALVSLGGTFIVLAFAPIISFGRHYVNVFVPG